MDSQADELAVSNLSEVVEIVWANASYAAGAVMCKFWNETGGHWSDSGLQTDIIGIDVHCYSNHMTVFGIILDDVATSTTTVTTSVTIHSTEAAAWSEKQQTEA
eukprot:6486898-Amphidinium_carterae.1